MAETPKPNPPAPTAEPKAEQATPQMSDAERQELEAYRAERAKAEALAKSIHTESGDYNLNLDPKTEAFRSLPIEAQIWSHYMHARGSIQDYARLFKMTVEQVLDILKKRFDIGDVAEVETLGDLIGADEIGEGDAPIRSHGRAAKVPFSLD